MTYTIGSSDRLTNNPLVTAIFIAIIIHIILVLGVNIPKPNQEKFSKTLDITLIDMPSEKAPENSRFLAQENQLESSSHNQPPESPRQAQSVPQINQIAPTPKVEPKMVHNKTNISPVKEITPGKVKTEPTTKPLEKKIQSVKKPTIEKKVITQKTAEKSIATEIKPAEANHSKNFPRLSAAMLHQQIAQMGTDIRFKPQASEKNRIKFVESVSANKYIAAQYLRDWESKVERIGNMNYPEAAIKKNISQTLTMDVGIKSDGSIYSIRITKSSGNPELDEAAKKIVRMGAPYPPLPVALRNEVDVLAITRIWKFTDESGLITQ
jgi:protein TonB